MELFAKIGHGQNSHHHWCLTDLWIRLWSWHCDFFLPEFPSKTVFPENYYKRMIRPRIRHSFFNKDLLLYKYPFWKIPSKNPGNAKWSIAVQYTLVPQISRQGKTVNDINGMWGNLGLILTLTKRYFSRRHSQFLQYYMKLWHCHVS